MEVLEDIFGVQKSYRGSGSAWYHLVPKHCSAQLWRILRTPQHCWEATLKIIIGQEGQSDSIAGRAFALLKADLSSISSILYAHSLPPILQGVISEHRARRNS